ncbi:chemotaxis-specific protein-glutamate methyltransferase CheB [Motiliproteus sp. MSK22-1]|uniref:chemotaxis-specific protein-glutamate methyltransferase CheB n=1 Tax=Motiliproteus sp. MSK22-1 TaxID=1897630 RepID=UPI000975C3E4|nr:chemotaxis-specific protein-glutamate methyltransferase CheB [Motiliproteus sp. MSK22-1]OMH32679.1 hypothetical protein BGP75_14140 [Motiliproteus sp. MSK22-1]
MIRILITEDSDVVAMLLQAILDNEPDMAVIGRARNGREAVLKVNELKPDLVTMDIRMPELDGLGATRIIMSTSPVPIVVISSCVDDNELQITFRAIEEGALAVLEKPYGLNHPGFEIIRNDIVDTVRAMSEVKVIRRKPARHTTVALDTCTQVLPVLPPLTGVYELVAIGISTGGPLAIRGLLLSLPLEFPVAILIAQHISKGFLAGLITWLSTNTLLTVKCAEDGETLKAATVYFAPDDYHLLVARNHNGLVAQLCSSAPVNGFRPSATPLLHSVARVCGRKGIGILMTGMGCDGAEGLLELRRNGGHTLVQDAESAVVYGMPGSALALDAVDQIVQLEKLPFYLNGLISK